MTRATRLTTPIVDAEDRPEWFDEKLLSYMPAIRKLANRLAPLEAEDLMQEAAMTLLKNWRSFRQDGGFYNWVEFNIRTVAACRRNITSRRAKVNVPGAERVGTVRGTDGGQETYADLSRVVDLAGASKAGQIAVRRAMGDGLREIAADMGISNQRVSQLAVAGHRALREAA